MNSPHLERIASPADLKSLTQSERKALAQELRTFIIDVVSRTGGHLASNLGVVELTIALHTVFDTPNDRIVWDVGHQTYTHKILTGRRERMHTLRQTDGLSGFPKREESPYDAFVAGHSSTSISAALGMAIAARLRGEDRRVVAVIGDGAMTAGMAFEALNNAGATDANLLVILNDNEMSISPNVGALNTYLTRLLPRGTGPGVPLEAGLNPLPLGKGIIRRQGRQLALLAFGSLVAPALAAADALDATVADMRFVKPLDIELIRELALTHTHLVTLEENVVMGGAGSAVAQALADLRLVRPILHLGLPDRFVEHGDRDLLLSRCGLDAAGIDRAVRDTWRELFS